MSQVMTNAECCSPGVPSASSLLRHFVFNRHGAFRLLWSMDDRPGEMWLPGCANAPNN